jgi:hypothetical protein
MTVKRAKFALTEMRKAVDDGYLQLAAQWSAIYMVETTATEIGIDFKIRMQEAGKWDEGRERIDS